MSKRRTFEEQAQGIEEQIARLRERQREVLARESEANRKGEDALRFALGGLVLECFENGWRTVDLDHLEEVVGHNSHMFASCTAVELPVEDAARRTRDWQRGHRERVATRVSVSGDASEGGEG